MRSDISGARVSDMARNTGIGTRTFGRLDTQAWQVHPESPSAVSISADRRARVLVEVGNLLLWLVLLMCGALLIRSGIVDGVTEPTSSILWTVGISGMPLAMICISWAERLRRKKTGYPVPPSVYGTVVHGAEAARAANERLETLEAAGGRPGFVGEHRHANTRELRLIGRHCELATRAERWLPWMMRWRTRRIRALSTSLRRRADELAPLAGGATLP